MLNECFLNLSEDCATKQDISLLNEAKEKLETIISRFCQSYRCVVKRRKELLTDWDGSNPKPAIPTLCYQQSLTFIDTKLFTASLTKPKMLLYFSYRFLNCTIFSSFNPKIVTVPDIIIAFLIEAF